MVDDALAGGVTSLQLRAKRMPGGEMYDLAIALRDRCRSAGALFFVNDRVDIAVAADADGVHVGMHDLPLDATRRLVGRNVIVGFSPLAMADVVTARSGGADYVGLGPVFGTASKADAQPELGLVALAEQAAAAALPSVGIGGIDVANAGAVIRAGVDGVASDQRDPGSAARETGRRVACARRQSGQDRALVSHSILPFEEWLTTAAPEPGVIPRNEGSRRFVVSLGRSRGDSSCNLRCIRMTR